MDNLTQEHYYRNILIMQRSTNNCHIYLRESICKELDSVHRISHNQGIYLLLHQSSIEYVRFKVALKCISPFLRMYCTSLLLFFQTRGRLSEAYDEPASGREGWWRCSIRVSVVPPAFSLIVGAAHYCSSENCIRRGTHPEAKVPLSTSEEPVPYH